ncbi:efflux RND transporter periplasmic adaptor subunit, partial [Balneolaceae bacterium ANBcel3]|nr:efflux RND transporter periplasmic adaptor subunit [Balneolaceae bacterium ANBcel3]
MSLLLRFLPVFLAFFLVSCDREVTQDNTGQIHQVPVSYTEVQIRDLSGAFTVSSEVLAYNRSYVAAQLSGIIVEVNAEEGHQVSQGEVLARIDTRRQQAELHRATISLDEALDQYERNASLYESDAVSRSEYLTSLRNYEQAQRAVEQLELDIDYGVIKAPISGMISARLIETGNSVSVNERVFTISNMDKLVLRPGVTELHLAKLEKEQPVEIRFDAAPGHLYDGS